jgi:phage terminase small subunit
MALNERQKLFAREYLIDFNATQAAKRAGYSEKTAYSYGQQLLNHIEIKRELEELQRDRFKSMEVTADKVIKEIAKIAFFDARKLFDDDGIPKHITKIDDDTSGAIAGLDVVSIGSGESSTGQILKYKIADKNAALEKLCKYLGLFKEDARNEDAPEPKQIIFTVKDARTKPAAE